MNTTGGHDPRKSTRLSLNASETVLLERPRESEDVEITVENGIVRIGTFQEGKRIDITLAFASKAEPCRFKYPEELVIRIEAITETRCEASYGKYQEQRSNDSIMEWVLQLHIVRHETNIESRLMKLFQLLTSRLGKRTPEGYLLEHTLSHSRIAEIIGSTRSTVSRAIGSLRKSNKIYIDELKNQLILPANQINGHTDMFHPSI
jgi:hypothetical protein